MNALDSGELRDAPGLKPAEEIRRRTRIGAAGVRVPDLAVKNSTKRQDARPPDAAMRAGTREATTGPAGSW
jgi:hypothetical protein